MSQVFKCDNCGTTSDVTEGIWQHAVLTPIPVTASSVPLVESSRHYCPAHSIPAPS